MIQPWNVTLRPSEAKAKIIIAGPDTPALAELRTILPGMETSRLVAMIADPASEILPYVIDDELTAITSRTEDTRIGLVAFILVCEELDARIPPRGGS